MFSMFWFLREKVRKRTRKKEKARFENVSSLVCTVEISLISLSCGIEKLLRVVRNTSKWLEPRWNEPKVYDIRDYDIREYFISLNQTIAN